MKSYISVNIVSQALMLLSAVEKNHCYSVLDLNQIRFPYGFNSESAMRFAAQCEWVKIGGITFEITSTGHKIEKLFDGKCISQELWREILICYITVCRPVWAKRIPYGRKEAYLIMNEEEKRCFDEAALMESIDESVVQWWDGIAEIERQKQDSIKNATGRRGEYLTLDYERKRTGIEPDWRSVETNLSGYDIMSVRSNENNEHILIEVKSSTENEESAMFFISRHEWDMATLINNRSRYYFYLWNLAYGNKRLAIIDVDTMASHIPDDNNTGKWETVSIPFSAFLSYFTSL